MASLRCIRLEIRTDVYVRPKGQAQPERHRDKLLGGRSLCPPVVRPADGKMRSRSGPGGPRRRQSETCCSGTQCPLAGDVRARWRCAPEVIGGGAQACPVLAPTAGEASEQCAVENYAQRRWAA
ncbi:hypothetical protein ACP4OV_008142 [Aristida adscensionis]